MGAIVEIAYYNTFILAGGGTSSSDMASSRGEYHVEEARIKGGYNSTPTDYGVKAHVVDDEYGMRTRENAMIYSGIFNAKTKVNNTNQFPIGAEITKAVDITNGSIQKLYAEDTDLNIFQENKVSKALIDKDAIYTAEGTPMQTISNVVIGQIVPYLGKYGISKNPESFAFFGGRKYFADKSRGVILRLSRDGITPISANGMKDFFRDNLPNTTSIYGMYDEQKDKYVISLQGSNISGGKVATSNTETEATSDYLTLGFDEKTTGWVSFYTYKPSFGFSLENQFYTFNKQNLYQHYKSDVARCSFYGSNFADPAYVNLLLNDNPSIIKNFLALSYEGDTGWSAESSSASYDNSTASDSYTAITEEAYKIPEEGVTIPNTYPPISVGFTRKEGKYFSFLKNKNNDKFNDNTQFTTTGLRGNYLDVTVEYWKPGDNTPDQGAKKGEMFAVSTEVQVSSN